MEPTSPQTSPPEIYATANAFKRAKELGVDLANIKGTGFNGRVTADDVKGHHDGSRAELTVEGKPGRVMRDGELVGLIVSGERPPDGLRRSQMHPYEQQREDSVRAFKVTNAALQRAGELGVSLYDVTGTGSNGRVTRDDVERHYEDVQAADKSRDESDIQGDESATGEHGGEAHDDQSNDPVVPGASAPPPVEVEPEPAADDRICFYCSTNPNFSLSSHKLGFTIYFTDGCYETDDPAEIAALRACQSVEEVSE